MTLFRKKFVQFKKLWKSCAYIFRLMKEFNVKILAILKPLVDFTAKHHTLVTTIPTEKLILKVRIKRSLLGEIKTLKQNRVPFERGL